MLGWRPDQLVTYRPEIRRDTRGALDTRQAQRAIGGADRLAVCLNRIQPLDAGAMRCRFRYAHQNTALVTTNPSTTAGMMLHAAVPATSKLHRIFARTPALTTARPTSQE